MNEIVYAVIDIGVADGPAGPAMARPTFRLAGPIFRPAEGHFFPTPLSFFLSFSFL